MDQETLTLIGAFGGGVLGVLGGIIGTWCSIKNTNGPRERAFVVKASILGWIGVVSFLTALWFTPMNYQVLLWLPYMALLPFAARAWNRKQQQIRAEESHSA
jgi:hypothetical protein